MLFSVHICAALNIFEQHFGEIVCVNVQNGFFCLIIITYILIVSDTLLFHFIHYSAFDVTDQDISGQVIFSH